MGAINAFTFRSFLAHLPSVSVLFRLLSGKFAHHALLALAFAAFIANPSLVGWHTLECSHNDPEFIAVLVPIMRESTGDVRNIPV